MQITEYWLRGKSCRFKDATHLFDNPVSSGNLNTGLLGLLVRQPNTQHLLGMTN